MIVCNEECAGGGVEVNIHTEYAVQGHETDDTLANRAGHECPKHEAPINNGK